jgi:hypothetical protein
MNSNTRCNHLPRRARRRPDSPIGAAAAAAAEHDVFSFEFDTLNDIPVIVHRDELWTICDMRFLGSRFGTPQADRLTAIVADGRFCVAARPWFETDENSINECGMFTGAIASRRFNGVLLVESRLPQFRSPLAARYPSILTWLERLTVATIEGRVS